MRLLPVAALVLATTTLSAIADEAPPPSRPQLVRGTIDSFDGKDVVIKMATGGDLSAAVSDKTQFAAVEKRTFAEIKPTDFIGVTSVPGEGDELRAEEIHIIPQRGLGEGQYAWDHHPEGASKGPVRAGTMTNGTVEPAKKPERAGTMTNATVTDEGKSLLKVSYHGASMVDGKCVGRAAPPPAPSSQPAQPGCVGTANVRVTPETQIVAIVPATKADIKPGLAVVAFVLTSADGKSAALSLTAEKNGVKPPF